MIRKNHLLTDCINCKIKRNLIHFTHLDGIDKKTSIDTHKSVQQPIHQSASSDIRYSELCDYTIMMEKNPEDPQGIRLYLQTTKKIYKEAYCWSIASRKGQGRYVSIAMLAPPYKPT